MAPVTQEDRQAEAQKVLDRLVRRGIAYVLERLDATGPQARPYTHRVESACGAALAAVIAIHADKEWRGSKSDAIRDLIARGATAANTERA